MKIFGFIFTLVGVCFLGTFIYLCLPSDVGYSEVDNLYMNMSSKQSMAMMLPVYGNDKDDWKDKVSNSMKSPKEGSFLYPIAFEDTFKEDNNVTEMGIYEYAMPGYSDWYDGNYHGGADIVVFDTARKVNFPNHSSGKYKDGIIGVKIVSPVTGTIKAIPTPGDDISTSIITIEEEGGGYFIRLMHFVSFNQDLKEGATINQGDFIGYMGSVGRYMSPTQSTCNHLHFEMMDKQQGGNNINPFTLDVVYPATKQDSTGVNASPEYTNIDNAWSTAVEYFFDDSVDAMAICSIKGDTNNYRWFNPPLQEHQIIPNVNGYSPDIISNPFSHAYDYK